ncbi:MAG: TatD family hydrolase [Rhodothermales bacterium]|nr:TatD family hydrolase [Rhodothermales bacterium]MBO6779915.1 TatD family hydrolase [Rhodothermales bacterium]
MLIDTHTHTYHRRFDDDRDDVIKRAQDAGVEIQLLPAIDVPSIHGALELAARHEGVYVMSALHPSDVKEASDADFAEVERLAGESAVVAIGETGLDYHWDTSFNDKQHDYLRRHIRLAAERDLPLVFHNRGDASEDLVRIVREEQEASGDATRIRGVFHCFGGTPEFGRQVMELGFHVGIGGTLTFKNAGVPEALEHVPMERIVLETDAPFLAPVPYRGKRNEPAYVRLVAQKLAEVRGTSVAEVEESTTANAKALFGLE